MLEGIIVVEGGYFTLKGNEVKSIENIKRECAMWAIGGCWH